jgi:hypothetical protein
MSFTGFIWQIWGKPVTFKIIRFRTGPSATYGDTYNIFMNETLYSNYLEYFSSSSNYSDYFLNLNAQLKSSFTPLQPVETTFLQSYSCQQRQLKSGVSLLLALITADYPFIVGGFTLVIWLAATFWHQRQKDGTSYTTPASPILRCSRLSMSRMLSNVNMQEYKKRHRVRGWSGVGGGQSYCQAGRNCLRWDVDIRYL